MRGKFVAYYRVSTQEQGKSGLGLEAQQRAVRDFRDSGKWELVAEFTEVESGKRADRPELAKAIALCRRQKARLVIAKLDRLSRDVAFIATLMKGVDFVAVDNPHANKFTIHILAAVAEFERDAISKRTREALAAAKARGLSSGTMPASQPPSRGLRLNGLRPSAELSKAQCISRPLLQLRTSTPAASLRPPADAGIR